MISHQELLKRARKHGITRIPITKTLNRYGLTEYEWLFLFNSQGWKCGCCRKDRQTWNIDHEHVPKWSRLEPEERKKYVRGILCWRCNKTVVGSRLSAADGRAIYQYLRAYELRRDRGIRS